ncbi:PPK2 family polyphosphate:nucleotide phosphotransferase [Dongia mobilis]|uniref:PPK2 family polyphosphate:nucleotide phosphotransferase n=1 Tax=Dongia mobilis TaxID=578943 RepID=A0A4R6WY77_9PROT|nr:PPK2 family polyphosphate kinase [Dongia mobilis]TDQ85463.1 PPK2 family polyphosphate:nucleotide phosphotransferase [Dongia mobilis]
MVKVTTERVSAFIAPYRVSSGRGFRLADFPTLSKQAASLQKEQAEDLLQQGRRKLSALQERLHAEASWSLLLILQGMDAAGKDGAIKHVMSGIDPQGVDVTSFKPPAGVELEHDFLWRCNLALPRRGRIGIFNRSYYEEVVAVRVYPHYLASQRLPQHCQSSGIWQDRMRAITDHERHLTESGTVIRKIFLNISREEQKNRLLARIEDPDKMWKFSPDDLRDRQRWPEFMAAYQSAIQATATRAAPWFVVPADNKAYARLVVAAIAIEALESMELAFPTVGPERARAARDAARLLAAESAKAPSRRRRKPA